MHMRHSGDILLRIKKRRNELGISQDGISASLGVERSVYSRKESGKTPITLVELINIAKELNAPVSYFLSGNTTQEAEDEKKNDKEVNRNINPIIDKINDMLHSMPDDQKRDVLKYTEKEKLYFDLMKRKKHKKAG